ncbi:RsmD family RNA methyltransferase [Rhodopirellula halodulae]|uniref:RsmD family RNA methyltransferase n=1 Tax=Rhodopirellula halodulae TaxID=2894198 RepID=UPI001E33795B|nr:RsmD family RNA methyltransferase [Rhodopirellula sp. JC737]MCC9657353.1 RsmD family RNA methyltransferase [Rhodopirellula sp. JC737]
MKSNRTNNRRSKPKQRNTKGGTADGKPTKLRIIGGDMRGRPVTYHGEEFTRPMRDSVRENLFNILGRACRGAIAFDLFAGTGVLGLEAISRGCTRAVLVEPMRKAIAQIRDTTQRLGIEDKVRLVTGDAFVLADQLLKPATPEDDTAWIVFMSPPYRMWTDPEDYKKLKAIITRVQQYGPPGSVLVVETDTTFETDQLPPGDWDIRTYGITNLAFLEPGNVCGLVSPFPIPE